MLAKVHSFVLQGIEPQPCEVEVDVATQGQPVVTVVGLPDTAVKESVERVRSALVNSDYGFPQTRLLVNLAPADIRKEGPVFDLPVALGLLLAENVVRGDAHDDLLFAGELALDGRLRPIHGVINMAILARRRGMRGVVVPRDNADEAATVDGVTVYPASSLADVVKHLNAAEALAPHPGLEVERWLSTAAPSVDFVDVRGQEAAKRALTVTAAGGHNALLIGPAGTGKSMMAKAFPGILPPMDRDEALEVTRVFSTVGQTPPDRPVITQRPVRTPHHTSSAAAMIGGGSVPKPGEVSLAHRGVLFLDEMPEFPRSVLETLRQPLEDGEVTISRAQGSLRFPARFTLLGAMNPTPRGDVPQDEVSQREMDRYLARLSGPLVDRIDLHVDVPDVAYEELTRTAPGTDSATMRYQVQRASEQQAARNGAGCPNAALSSRALDELAPLESEAHEVLRQAIGELGLSARAYDKVRRVARTIADLEECERVESHHVAEAVQYRQLDRQEQ